MISKEFCGPHEVWPIRRWRLQGPSSGCKLQDDRVFSLLISVRGLSKWVVPPPPHFENGTRALSSLQTIDTVSCNSTFYWETTHYIIPGHLSSYTSLVKLTDLKIQQGPIKILSFSLLSFNSVTKTANRRFNFVGTF